MCGALRLDKRGAANSELLRRWMIHCRKIFTDVDDPISDGGTSQVPTLATPACHRRHAMASRSTQSRASVVDSRPTREPRRLGSRQRGSTSWRLAVLDDLCFATVRCMNLETVLHLHQLNFLRGTAY